MQRHIVYSHGFGVRQDDRGLFTDIAEALPEYEHTMFDYNDYDDEANTLIARPIDQQVAMLLSRLDKLENEGAVVDIVAHSQGCIVAAMANPRNVRRTIFLAPPAQFLGMDKKSVYALRPETRTDDEGTLYMPRRDGSTTIIKEDYWKSREGIKPIELYNAYSHLGGMTIIKALQDEVLEDNNFTGLSEEISLIEVEANHDFTGDSRPSLLSLVSDLLNRQ